MAVEQRRLPSDRSWVFMILLVGVIVLTCFMTGPYLLSIFFGILLAMLGKKLYVHLTTKRGLKPAVSAGLVTSLITFLILGPLLAFSVVVVDQAIDLGQKLSQYEGISFAAITDRLNHFKPVRTLIGDSAAVDTQLRSTIQSAGKAATGAILATVALMPEMLLQLVLSLLTCYFWLMDGRRFIAWGKKVVPIYPSLRDKIFDACHETASLAIWAGLAAAGIQMAIMLVAYLVLNVPLAFLAAGATFFFAWIPILGSTPVWIVATIYLWSNGLVFKAVLMLVFGAICGLSDNFARALVLKGKGNMHPLVALVAIFGGISMFGILGVFIGPIVASLFIVLLSVWPEVRSAPSEP